MAITINPSDQTITQYNIQTGGASNLLNNVAPSSTSGVPVISQGASSQPVFGTAVVAGGGTGQVTLTNHGVLIGQATSAIAATTAGSAGQVLQSGGASADPAYSTATFPGTATGTGTLLRADGTNWVATTSTYPNTNAVSTLLYASSANVMGALTTANNGTLVTSNSGVPSILAGPGTTGNILQSNAAAAPSFSTATYPSTAGTSGNVLTSDGTNWVSSAAPSGFVTITGNLTNTQIKNLHASPVTVLAAPGSGKWYRLISANGKFIYGGSNVFVAGAGQTITWYYGTTLSSSVNLISNAVLVGSTTVYAPASTNPPTTFATTVENQTLTLYNSNATEISGNASNDNTITYVVTYQIVNI